MEVHVFPGVRHGYTMRGNTKVFDKKIYDFSMERALAILERLRKTPVQSRIGSAERSADR
jgi:hypothetical protein